MLGRGMVDLSYSDQSEPYELITSADLPKSEEDLDFDAADQGSGGISTASEESFWLASFSLEQ